jgi:integrase
MLQSHAVEKYLEELRLLRKPNTYIASRQILYEFLNYVDSNDIRGSVLTWLAACKAKGNSLRTLEHKRIRVTSFYRTLGIELKIPRIKCVSRRPEIYSEAELDAIFRAARLKHPRRYWLYKMFLQSGLRWREAMYLEWSNLLDGGGIQVAPHSHFGDWTPKDHEERVVSVPAGLIAGLRLLSRNGPLVFPTLTGHPDTKMLLSLKATAKRAGLDPAKCWLHKFRSTFAVTLLRRGIDIRTVMRQLGHSRVETTMKYLVWLDDDRLSEKIEQVWS